MGRESFRIVQDVSVRFKNNNHSATSLEPTPSQKSNQRQQYSEEEYVTSVATRLQVQFFFSQISLIILITNHLIKTVIEANLDDDEVITSTLTAVITVWHFRTIYEREDFLCVECFVKRNYVELMALEQIMLLESPLCTARMES